MNTMPLFVQEQHVNIAQADKCVERAQKRLAFIRRLIRDAEAKLKAYELALTDAALRGRFPAEGSMARVLEGQLDGLRLEERVAEADLYAADEARKRSY